MRSGNRERILRMSVSFSVPDKPAKRGTDGHPPAPQRSFSRAELARYDGSDPNLPVLIAYKDKVYDVTESYPWAKGVHWGKHRAGQDLTACLDQTIHGEEMLLRVPCAGIFDPEWTS